MMLSNTVRASVPLAGRPPGALASHFASRRATPINAERSSPTLSCRQRFKWKSSEEEGTATLKGLQGVDVGVCARKSLGGAEADE